jgi:hypothetical protein
MMMMMMINDLVIWWNFTDDPKEHQQISTRLHCVACKRERGREREKCLLNCHLLQHQLYMNEI